MPKSIAALGGICLVLALAAPANDAPPPTQTVEEAAEPAASDASASTAKESSTDAREPPDKQADESTAEDVAAVKEDPIVCRRVEVTGTRLKRGKVCLAESEWRKMREDARSAMKEVDRKTAVQRCALPPC